MMNETPTTLVALDWGTSSLRAFRMDASGKVLERRANRHGILNLPGEGKAGFERAFEDICAGWIDDRTVPVIAGGMVGSAQGWLETPYLRCPVSLSGLAADAKTLTTQKGHKVVIAPGVKFDDAAEAPDVMRGEEIQIAGTLAGQAQWTEHSLLVLPGTHSKWAEIRDGRIVRFSTYMTGEIFSVLRQHSILGKLMPDDGTVSPEDAARAFNQGLSMARDSQPGDLTRQLFSVRTLGLTERMPKTELADYLSGLLIGHELVSGLAHTAALQKNTPLVLIGESALCARYAQALSLFSVVPAGRIENPAPHGLFWLAGAAGLITQ